MGLASYSNCSRCGKLFIKTGTKNVCGDCIQKEEEDFHKVKEYLYDYPNSSIDEVAEQTDVEEDIITEWIKDGRLEAKGITISYPCSVCGKPIHVGKICARCQKQFGDAIGDLKSALEDDGRKTIKDQIHSFSTEPRKK